MEIFFVTQFEKGNQHVWPRTIIERDVIKNEWPIFSTLDEAEKYAEKNGGKVEMYEIKPDWKTQTPEIEFKSSVFDKESFEKQYMRVAPPITVDVPHE